MSWARWLTSVIPVVGRRRQEGQKFQGQSRPPRSVWATENPGGGGEKGGGGGEGREGKREGRKDRRKETEGEKKGERTGGNENKKGEKVTLLG